MFNNVIIKGNIAQNLNGGYLYSYNATSVFSFRNIVIEDNNFEGDPNRYMEYHITIGRTKEVSTKNNISIRRTIIKKHRPASIYGFKSVIIESNTLDYVDSDLTVTAFHIRDVDTLLQCRDNVFLNHSTATNQITYSQVDVSPIIALTKGNIAKSLSGTLFFRTNLENKGVLNEIVAQTNVTGSVLKVAASPDTATQAVGDAPTKAEFDALLAELRDLKTKMRAGTAPVLSS